MSRCHAFARLVVSVVAMTSASTRAESLPMAFNDTTLTVLSDCTFEDDSPSSAGGYLNLDGGGGEIVASDGSVTANEAEKFLRILRDGAAVKRTWIGFESAPAAGTAMAVNFAERLGDAHSLGVVAFGTTEFSNSVADFRFVGDGTVAYYDAGSSTTVTIPGLEHVIGQWNDVVLTHANGSALWNISVNDSAPVAVAMTGTNKSASPAGMYLRAGNSTTVMYLDAAAAPIPEPEALWTAALGLIGMLGYAWSRRR